VEDGHCQLLDLDGTTRILLLHFYIELIQQAFQELDACSDQPFPDESSFSTPFPPDQIRPISVEFDLPGYIEDPQTTPLPALRLTFPNNLGNTIILATMVPNTLLEAAFLKIRNYMRSHNNKEYFQHKLAPAFQGKESQLREVLNQITIKPFEALRIMQDAGEFSYLFWSYFNNLLKHDITQRKDPLPGEIAALQSVYIIEVFNSYYKGKEVKR
jgi:hypothetical protein